ncbi:uncharacterized protein BKA78DRAFT_188628 [Phyllosticta capitalensis]|uniref:uncharacterized protein n=1 Tax=Phyllosticta capitalensis TaxID=121624 RepID=UPI00312E141B
MKIDIACVCPGNNKTLPTRRLSLSVDHSTILQHQMHAKSSTARAAEAHQQRSSFFTIGRLFHPCAFSNGQISNLAYLLPTYEHRSTAPPASHHDPTVHRHSSTSMRQPSKCVICDGGDDGGGGEMTPDLDDHTWDDWTMAGRFVWSSSLRRRGMDGRRGMG